MSWPSPVAIGGVGGSGTRLVAEVLRALGYYMGGDLNEATDNLWFTLLFKRTELWQDVDAGREVRRGFEVFHAAMNGASPLSHAQAAWVRSLAAVDRPQHDAAWLGLRVESLLAAAGSARAGSGPWGWKEPNTHVLLDRLADAVPELVYVHVMRNGLDMAYSANQNQVKLWGRSFLGVEVVEPTPRTSLDFWCRVHRRVADIGQRMPGRFLLLNYDALCRAPQEGLRTLLRFLGVAVSATTEASLLALVRSPASIGRFRRHALEPFGAEAVAYVKSLGFETM